MAVGGTPSSSADFACAPPPLGGVKSTTGRVGNKMVVRLVFPPPPKALHRGRRTNPPPWGLHTLNTCAAIGVHPRGLN